MLNVSQLNITSDWKGHCCWAVAVVSKTKSQSLMYSPIGCRIQNTVISLFDQLCIGKAILESCIFDSLELGHAILCLAPNVPQGSCCQNGGHGGFVCDNNVTTTPSRMLRRASYLWPACVFCVLWGLNLSCSPSKWGCVDSDDRRGISVLSSTRKQMSTRKCGSSGLTVLHCAHEVMTNKWPKSAQPTIEDGQLRHPNYRLRPYSIRIESPLRKHISILLTNLSYNEALQTSPACILG